MNRLIKTVKFDDKGLVPAIIQDHKNGDVLMFAFLNRTSLQKTLETKLMHYYSRSRQKLWLKGEESGHVQRVKSFYADCDSDCLLFNVEQVQAACHVGYRSCFFSKGNAAKQSWKATGKKIFDPSKVYKTKHR